MIVGSYVYSGELTKTIRIQDNKIKSDRYKIVATCQDIGSPIYVTNSIGNGGFTVVLTTETTVTRINYIGFEL